MPSASGHGFFFALSHGAKLNLKVGVLRMKVIELMKIDQKVLELLHDCCIRIDDVRYVDLFGEYKEIVDGGGKMTYAVAFLAEKYGISERKVYYLIRKFSKDCNVYAVR